MTDNLQSDQDPDIVQAIKCLLDLHDWDESETSRTCAYCGTYERK